MQTFTQLFDFFLKELFFLTELFDCLTKTLIFLLYTQEVVICQIVEKNQINLKMWNARLVLPEI